MLKYFGVSFFFTFLCLVGAGYWGYHNGGWQAVPATLFVVVVLGIMEVSLSFDNAIVNASVLKKWNKFWKKIFLTIGIFVAVFGMRLLFPLLIVAFTADMSIFDVWSLALKNPSEYSAHLISYHAEISTFGGMFLLLVFLNFMLDSEKKIHWISYIEKVFEKAGKADAISVLIALIVLLSVLTVVPHDRKLSVLIFGLQGIIVYLVVTGISSFLEQKEKELGSIVKKGSIGGFLYLEILDASFSFDGVIGAFAITKDIVLIMIGLGIGAMFVRSITIYLVNKGTLNSYIYLEHGAHWAIGALSAIMLLSVKFHIHEVITGLIGVVFIGASTYSSIRFNRQSNMNKSVKIK